MRLTLPIVCISANKGTVVAPHIATVTMKEGDSLRDEQAFLSLWQRYGKMLGVWDTIRPKICDSWALELPILARCSTAVLI